MPRYARKNSSLITLQAIEAMSFHRGLVRICQLGPSYGIFQPMFLWKLLHIFDGCFET